jgi:hypothetical protein
MTEERGPTGPQFHADRPREQEAVRTTIVGGRPPGSGKSVGNIPRGIEVLVKKAAVDPAFKAILLDRRAEAADEIGLKLEPAEAMMLAAAPREQLETVIANTHVPEEQRRAFLGKVAAVMLSAVGATAALLACNLGHRPNHDMVKGTRPDPTDRKRTISEPPVKEGSPKPLPAEDTGPGPSPSRGTRPDQMEDEPTE